ncbi:alpha/beta hydrolase [Halobacterium sp. R2-5]|uniref:alpha/beta hydrolase n=1 Tax=Halobacterium sp. R2-5 TaxID=2715751 RepID=UPI00141D98D6|nr:alpha/beta hydrolase [Halobacterium sp. R2-5]NIB99278.1 alpha/beta hydrolase [Halobacterium sp. R2-5]
MARKYTLTTRRQFLSTAGAAAAALTLPGSAFAQSDTPTPSSDVTFHEGLTYAERDSGELKLDLYLPDSEEPTPLVVFVHGGGWLVNTRKDTPDLEEYFVSRGYAMATVDHRLSEIPEDVDPIISPSPDNPVPRGTFPDHIVDVKAAIRWLRGHADEYNLDPERVATWGSSSGSHLAVLAGTAGDVEEIEGDVYDIEKTVYPGESGRVQAVVGWYTPTDFLKMDPQLDGKGFSHDAPNSPESLLVGGQITENEELVERADPITYVDPDDPPFLLMHGRQDVTVPYQQSTILYDALSEACVDTTYYELHDLGHGFGFDGLTQKPTVDQTITKAKCTPGDGKLKERVSNGPPAGPKVIEQFLDRTLSN